VTARDWTLVYDGECAFCLRCVAVLRRWDRRGRLAFLPLQDERTVALLPAVPRSALEAAMHLVAPDGGTSAGAATLPHILRLVPGGRPLAVLIALPGVRWAADRLYRLVARNRRRLGCDPEGDQALGANAPAGYVPERRDH
jgi:acetyl esterase